MTGPRDPAELRARMVEQVMADDDVARWSVAVAPWRAALATVPRHKFIPATIWVKNPGAGATLVPLHREDDPQRWLRLSYRAAYDSCVVTQIDMLSATGYEDVCTTVGDGAFGYAPNAPYDRVIATAAVRTIPYSWVEQTRPTGRVLLPWANSFADALWPYDAADGVGVLWLLDFGSRSWAKVIHCTPEISDSEFPVRQHGPRRLWDEVDAAHQWWVDQGRPGPERWRFAVAPNGQRIEFVNR